MPTRGKNPRDEFDRHEMESRSSVDQHKNQKGGNKMKRRIEMSEIPIGIAASALGAVEFVMKDAKAALTTMSDNPHVLMVPIAIGGRGAKGSLQVFTTITFSLDSLLTSGPYPSRRSSEKIFLPKRPP